MEDDDVDDLWGPPLVVRDDTFRKPLRGCEFWFDFRTDVLEESFQMERYCELVWTILNEKKIDELVDKDVVGSPDSEKTLSATLPDAADTSSAKSSLDEDENTSSISDAQTMQNKDSTNDAEEVDLETSLKPQETGANEEVTAEVAEDGDTPCSPVLAALASMIEEAEEHSCSSLVTQQVFDPPIQQVTENKSPSAISQENNGEGPTLTPLVETKEKANATNEEGEEVLKDQQQQKQSDSLQDIETVSEPFTTESLLEMCDEEPEKVREEAPCDDEKSKRSMPEALKIVVKEEPIINMLLTEARIKVEESKEALLNPSGSVLTKKRKIATSNSTSLIRNTKKKSGSGETPTESKPTKIITTKGPSVPPQLSPATLDLIDRIRQRRGVLLSELKDKTGKELRYIAKELKVTHYYKMKKEDLLQNCIMQLRLQLTGCKEGRIMES